MDFKSMVDTAIAQAKADVDEIQAEGMVVVDAWCIIRAVLLRLPNASSPPAEPVAALAVPVAPGPVTPVAPADPPAPPIVTG